MPGVVVEKVFVGANTIYLIESDFGTKISVSTTNTELPADDKSFVTGDRVTAVWRDIHASEIPA